jgi:hypothetical protein
VYAECPINCQYAECPIDRKHAVCPIDSQNCQNSNASHEVLRLISYTNLPLTPTDKVTLHLHLSTHSPSGKHMFREAAAACDKSLFASPAEASTCAGDECEGADHANIHHCRLCTLTLRPDACLQCFISCSKSKCFAFTSSYAQMRQQVTVVPTCPRGKKLLPHWRDKIKAQGKVSERREATTWHDLICQSCPDKTYQSSVKPTECAACPAGRINPKKSGKVFAPLDCISCQPGWFQPFDRTTKCLACGVGRFAAEKHSKYCPQCPAGYIQDTQGGARCTACSQGKHQVRFVCRACVCVCRISLGAVCECVSHVLLRV